MVFRNNLHHRLPQYSRTSLGMAVCSVLTVDHGRLGLHVAPARVGWSCPEGGGDLCLLMPWLWHIDRDGHG